MASIQVIAQYMKPIGDDNLRRARAGYRFSQHEWTQIDVATLTATQLEDLLRDEYLDVADVDTLFATELLAADAAKKARREAREAQGMVTSRHDATWPADAHIDALDATLDSAVAAVIAAAGL